MTTIAPPTTWTWAFRVLALGLALLADWFHGTTEITLLVAAATAGVAMYVDIRRRTLHARSDATDRALGLTATR